MSDKHAWICKGCLLKAGLDPDGVGESCIGRQGKCTCDVCSCVQDSSWFKHAVVAGLPEELQQVLASPFRIIGKETPQPTFKKEPILCSWCNEPAVARGKDGTWSCGSGQGDGKEHHCNIGVAYTHLHTDGIGWERIR